MGYLGPTSKSLIWPIPVLVTILPNIHTKEPGVPCPEGPTSLNLRVVVFNVWWGVLIHGFYT